MDSSIEQLIQTLFSNDPPPPNSFNIELSIDESLDINDEVSQQLAKQQSEILMNFFVSGCEIIYGEPVNPSKLSQIQIDHMNKYIHALGFHTNFEYTYDENNKPTKLDIFFTEFV